MMTSNSTFTDNATRRFCVGDVILATVTRQGRDIAHLTLHGVTSLTDVLRQIQKALNGVMGMIVLTLRNSSQGWQQRCPIVLKPLVA